MTTIVLLLGVGAFGLFCIIRPDYILDRAGKKKNKEYEKKDYKVIRIFGAVLLALFLLGLLSLIGGYYHAA